MVTLLFWITSAGQPNSRIHFLQEMQDSSSTNRGASGLSMAIQGDLNMIAFTPGRSAVRFTQETACLLYTSILQLHRIDQRGRGQGHLRLFLHLKILASYDSILSAS